MVHRALLKHIDSRKFDLRKIDTSQPQNLSAKSYSDTHKGLVRLINEDACLELSEQRLWVVADGMGGHKRGDYASRAVIKALEGFKQGKHHGKDPLTSLVEDIQKRLVEANEVCQKAFRAKRIGSTVTLLFEYGGYCFFLWAGDSRIYRLRDNKLQQMTHDHSLAQEKFTNGELNQDEAKAHPSAHILTRAVGVHRHLKLELHGSRVLPGDRYLLCSDGLYGSVDDAQLHANLSINTPETALNGLISSALDAGGRDNITAIIVDFTS